MEVKKITPVFIDERGSIYDILEEEVRHVGMITSKKGSVRGKHYHKESTQYTFVISGKLEFIAKDLRWADAKVESVILGPGDLIITPPMVVHAMKFLEDSIMLDMTTKSRSIRGYEEDTVRVEFEVSRRKERR